MIERHKDGTIKDFSVPDAHTLTVSAFLVTAEGMKGQNVKKETMVIPSLDLLTVDFMHQLVDPQDGMICGVKWSIDSLVVKSLRDKGEAHRWIPGHPLRFEYKLRKTRYADELKHKG